MKSIFFVLHVTVTVHPHTKEMLQQQYIEIKEVLHIEEVPEEEFYYGVCHFTFLKGI